MNRPRVVLAAVVVSAYLRRDGSVAQTAASAEGWVVLPVEEYRALRERAIPPAPPPLAPPVDATLTRVDYDLRVGSDSIAGRALLMIDVLKARLDPRPDSRRPDGARCAARRPAGLARRRSSAARVAGARRPRRAHARHRHPADGVGRHGIGRASGIAVADIAGRAGAAEERSRPLGDRRLHRRSRRDGRRKPVDRIRPPEPAAHLVVEAQGRRSTGGTAAACARAR